MHVIWRLCCSHHSVRFFSLNVAPILLQEFLPLLQRASFDGTYQAVRLERAAIVNISSILGSVAENNHAEHYQYGPTKVSQYEPRHEKKKKTRLFAYAKTKTQISFAITAKLISVFVFATRIVQSLYFLYTKFQASSHLV